MCVGAVGSYEILQLLKSERTSDLDSTVVLTLHN